jgi:two-component system cell cycle sensor histidine kinase/response regulator CckA
MTTRTVPVAEDDGTVRTLARLVLEQAGYDVLEASDGLAALEIASAHPRGIDVLVTDVVMPFLSGPALAARITQLSPAMRVLYMTGYDPDEEAARGLQTDDAPTILKPVTPEELQGAVEKLLHPAAPQ